MYKFIRKKFSYQENTSYSYGIGRGAARRNIRVWVSRRWVRRSSLSWVAETDRSGPVATFLFHLCFARYWVFPKLFSFPSNLSGLFWGKTCSKKVKALFSKVQWSVKRLDLLEKPLLEGVIIYWKKRYFLWWSSSWEITRYLYKKCCHVKPVLLPEVETNILFRQKTSLNTCQYFVVFPS